MKPTEKQRFVSRLELALAEAAVLEALGITADDVRQGERNHLLSALAAFRRQARRHGDDRDSHAWGQAMAAPAAVTDDLLADIDRYWPVIGEYIREERQLARADTRVGKIEALLAGATTPGERDAAQAALDRIKARS